MKAIRLTTWLFILITSLFYNQIFAQTCPTSGPVTVTNTADTGVGSLRWAIGCVNSNASVNEIVFDITTSFSIVEIILSTQLPVITSSNITIDGANLGTPSTDIVLFGAYTSGGNGLNHSGINSNFKNIEIIGFAGHGINANSSQNAVFENINSHDNGSDGIFVTGASTSVSLTDCVTNNNFGDGFESLQSDNITFDNITSNSNGSYGIYLRQSDNVIILSGETSGNTKDGVNSSIGGASPISISNFIANNNAYGILINGRTQATFSDVTLDNNMTNGVSCALQIAANTATYTNVISTNNGNYGVNCGTGDHTFINLISNSNGQGVEANCDDLFIDGGTINNNTGDGIDSNVDNDTEIKNLSIASNGMNGIDMTNPAGATVMIDNCTIDDNGSRQIWVRSSNNVTIQNSIFTNGPTAGVPAIELSGTNYLITGNVIGNASGANNGIGVEIGSSGTTGVISGNTIGHNLSKGINERSNSTILISQNDIFCNGGVGIDREPAAPNVPVITTATPAVLEGTAPPNSLVEIFLYEPICTTSVMGYYQTNVLADAAGDWSVATSFSIGYMVTATATANGDNTSEFAAFATVAAPACPTTGTVTVENNSDDSNTKSLRWAIGCANTYPAVDNIEFAIPGAGPHYIDLMSPHLKISDNGVTLDGISQPAGEIILRNDAALSYGLEVLASNVSINTITVEGFSGGLGTNSGISAVGVDNLVLDNIIAQSNRNGIYLWDCNNPVLNNITSTNNNRGLQAGSNSAVHPIDLTVSNSSFDSNTELGVYIQNFAGTIDFSAVTASNNIGGGAPYGMYIDNTETIIFDDVDCIGNNYTGLNFLNIATSISLNDIDVSGNDRGGLGIQTSALSTLTNITADNNVGFTGIAFANSSNVTMTNATANGNRDGVSCQNPGSNITFTNVTASNNTNRGFSLYQVNDLLLTNCVAENSARDNFILTQTTDATLDGITSRGSTGGSFNGVHFSLANTNFNLINSTIGDATLGNNNIGVKIDAGSNGLIENNTIANNGGDGINAPAATTIKISKNAIFCNGDDGIDKPTPSVPVITSATPTSIEGTADPNSDVEIFIHDHSGCSGITTPQGKTWQTTTSADGSGNWTVTGLSLTIGNEVTATATNSAGDNTSEFAAFATVAAQACPTSNPVTVTNANDSGDGSLRWAIDCANTTTGLNIIHFNIPGTPFIQPTTSVSIPFFPSGTLTAAYEIDENEGIFIDGSTQPGVTINGLLLPTGDGLVINDNNNHIIKDITVEHFDGSGISTVNTANLITLDSVKLKSNGDYGFGTDGADLIEVTNCIATLNGKAGFFVTRMEDITITGSEATLNGDEGIKLVDISDDNVGVNITNVIAVDNGLDGVLIDDYTIANLNNVAANANYGAGIRILNGSTSLVGTNLTANNNIGSHGIDLSSSVGVDLTTVTSVANFDNGLNILNCSAAKVTGGTITDNVSGILADGCNNLELDGLVVSNNDFDGIEIQNSSPTSIKNTTSQMHTSGAGLRLINSSNCTVDGFTGSNNILGISCASNNLIAINSAFNNNTSNGIFLSGSSGSFVGTVSFTGNVGGFSQEGASNNTTIQNCTFESNVDGITSDDCEGFNFDGNTVGTAANGNTGNGIWVNNSSGTKPGTGGNSGTFGQLQKGLLLAGGIIQNNTITNNDFGIKIEDDAALVEITNNEIYCNSTAGIDRTNNTPPITTISSASTTTVTGTTLVASGYIEVFIDDDMGCSGAPEQGKTFVGSNTFSGSNWSVPISGVSVGDNLTATITANSNNTSQFSIGVIAGPTCPIGSPVIVTDPGDGSMTQTLRWAIDCVNADASTDEIHFNLPAPAPGDSLKIQPTGQLPFVIDDDVYFDGTTQPTGDRVYIDGSMAGSAIYGLSLQANTIILRQLGLINWGQDGIQNFGNSDLDDIEFLRNGGAGGPAGSGIRNNSGSNNTIINNSYFEDNEYGVSGFSSSDLQISNSNFKNHVYGGVFLNNTTNSILDNLDLDNCSDGISVVGLSQNTSINNVTSYNNNDVGIYVGQSDDVTIDNATCFNNGDYGIQFLEANNSDIINSTIYSNSVHGVYITNTTNFTIEDNDIGVSGGNTADGILVEDLAFKPGGNTNNITTAARGGLLSTGTIQNNNIQNNGGYGVQASSSLSTSPNLYIVNNNMQCNQLGGIVNPTGTAPTISTANPATVTGTGTNGNTIHLYTHNTSCSNGAPCQGLMPLGTTTVSGGVWSVAATVSAGTQVTATQTTSGNNTSPFSTCALVMLMCDADTTSTNVTCFGFDDGTATSTGNSMANYTYTWSNNPSSPIGPQPGPSTITGLSPGTYYVTVADGAGCIDVDTFVITQPFPIDYFLELKDETCIGFNNGEALMEDYGAGYTVLWSTGSTANPVTNLAPGMYSVTVTNPVTMCADTTNFTINPGFNTIDSTRHTNVTCFGFDDGTATVFVNPITTAAVYSWSTGATTSTVTGLSPGWHYITVTIPPGADNAGCFEIDSVNVLEAIPLSYFTEKTDETCAGANDGTALVDDYGNGYTYLWSTGSTASMVSGLVPGMYSVTITDPVSMCMDTANFTINPAPDLILSMDSTHVTCVGLNDGTATVNINTVVAMDPSLTIMWSTGSSATMISGLAPGVYSVTVVYTEPISVTTCSETRSVTINDGNPLNYYSDIEDETCINGNDGSAFIDDLGAGYTYLWSTGSTANPITNLGPGNYSVTITEGVPNFCADTFNFVINPGLSLIASLDSTNVTCNGFDNGTATVTLDPNIAGSATGTTTIEWYTFPAGTIVSTSNPVSNLAPGQYEVVVTFIDGGVTCSETEIFSISEPDPIVSNLNFEHENCLGANDGSASVNPTGGTSPYTFSWSTGSTASMVSNLSSGTYTITIRDANMCELTETFIINPGYTPIDNIVGTNLLCFEDMTGSAQVILNPPPVGAQPTTYSWSNGATVNPNPNLAAGTYGVTVSTIVTSGDECIGTGMITISQPDPLTIMMDSNNVSCFGGSDGTATANVTGGTMPYSYLWSNMANTSMITGLAPGTYTVTVTDGNDCSAISSVEIFEPLEYITGISGTDLLCNGDNSGTAEVLVSGSPLFYIYSWSNGDNTRSISGLAAGTYTVTVTDTDFVCEEIETITINEPPVLGASPIASNSVTCFGFSDGTLETNPTGGTLPYTFAWTPGGYTTANVTGVPPGAYTVVVTDANMCQSTPATVFIGEPLEFLLDLDSTDLTCFENASGSITANPINGVSPINYAWSNGASGMTTSGLAVGSYSVTATDENGCLAEGTSSVNQPTMVTGTTSSTITTCNGDDDGTATATGAGGTPGYTYAWSNGDNGPMSEDLSAGTYFVSITDQNGCEIIEEVEIIEPDEIFITFDSTNVTCAGLNDGTATAMATGGTGGPYDFIWEDGTFGPSITGLSAGFHEVEAIDANGCFGLWDVEILEPNPIALTASATNITATGANDGTATASGAGDFPPFMYAWSNGDTGANISNLAPGGYTVTCTDTNGCFVEETVFVGGINCNLIVDVIDITNVDCNTGTNGALTVNHSGGTAPHTYIWSNGGNTQTITGLTAGSYSVTVVDVQNCVDSMRAVITEPMAIIPNLTSVNVSGLGINDGSATLAPTGGTPTYTYLWSTGATTSAVNGLAPGTYTATITDANQCEEIVTVNISSFNCNFDAGVATPMDATCFGEPTGSVSTAVVGGTPPYNYTWSNGETTSNITNVLAGNYSVTVIDATNCPDTLRATVNEPSIIVLVNSSTNEMSNGANDGTASVIPSGGTPTYTYLWSNGETTSMISGLAPGDYTVTCTDANGCERESMVMTIEPYVCSFAVASSNTTDVLCNGDATGGATVATTGGTGPFTYAWSDGSSAAALTGVMAGTYSVSITDAFDCVVVEMVEIMEPSAISATSSITGLTTNNGNEGTATANPSGGTPNYTFVWSNGDTNQTATGLTEGTYSVTCTDANGCTVILNDIEIPAFDCILEIENITPTDVLCFGDMDGTASAQVINAVGNVNYTWSSGATVNPATNLEAGTYTLVVSDDTNCTDESDVEIAEPSAITSNLSTNNQSAAGVNDGSASVNPMGGTPPYSVTWSNGDTGNNTSGLAPGNYTVSILDVNNCEITEPFTIQNFNCDLEIINLTSTPVTCFGDNDGTATPIVTGGDGNYTFSWSNGSVDSIVTNGTAGLQILSVSDNSNCTDADTVTIGGPPELFVNLTTTDESAAGAMDGTALVAPSGGVPAYTILWSTGDATNSIVGLSPNTYSVEVTDMNNCSLTESVSISAFNCDLVLNNIIKSDVTCFGFADGTATPFVSGGDGNYTFDWDNGTQDSVLTATSGTYNLVVTDGANCSATGMITIDQPAELVSNFSFTNETASGAMDGTATVNPMGGTPNYTVLWSTGETSNSVNGLAPGSYNVVITDMNNCEITESFTVQGFGCNLVAESMNTTDVTCFGLSNGTATSVISGEVNPVNYQWSNGGSTATINNLIAGSYFLTITDANNCVALDTAIISEPAELSIILNGTNASVGGTSDGAVTSMVDGGVRPYTYSWSNGETTEDLSGIPAGMYTLEITDANNCTASESIQITNDGSPCDLEISVMQIRSVRCFGESNGSLIPVTLGGVGPMTFLWSNGATDSIAANLPSGELNVLITDQNGCTARDTAFVPQPDTMILTITSTDQTVFGTNDGTASASAIGGNQPYEWIWNNGETTAAITDLAPGVYSLIATDRNGCEATGSVRIRDANDPICETFAGTMAADTLRACAGDTLLATQMDPAILDSDDIVEYVLHDSPSDLLGNILSRNDIPEFSFLAGMATDRPYYISAIAGNDDGFGSVDLQDTCLSIAIGQVAIFVNSPSGVYTMQGPNMACGNVPFFLEAGDLVGANSGVQYRWVLPTGDVVFTEEPTVSIIPSSNLFTGDYYVSRDSAGCASPISAPIFIEIVSLAPDVINAGRDTILCQGNTYRIEATSTLNEPGSWSPVGSAAIVSPNQLSTEVTGLQPGANDFVWKVALDECPTASVDTVRVIVETPPEAANDFYVLDNATDVIPLEVLSNDNLSGLVDTVVSIISPPQIGNLEYDPVKKQFSYWLDEAQRGYAEFTYEVCNPTAECGIECDRATVTIYSFAYPVLPDGITPNGDGDNDFLQIQGLKGFDFVKVTVVNRWGSVVYQTDNYDNDNPWDGTYNNDGNPLPGGTYYYFVEGMEQNGSEEPERVGRIINGPLHIINR